MGRGEGRLSIISLIRISLFVALILTVSDAIALYKNSILGLEELFLLQTGLIHTSIIAYTFILIFLLCAVLSLIHLIIPWVFPRLFSRVSWIAYLLIYMVGSFVVLMGLRFHFMDSRADFKNYLLSFLIFALFLLIIVGLVLFFLNTFIHIHKRVRSLALFSIYFFGFIALFFLPKIYSVYFEWRFNPRENDRGLPNVLFIVMDTARADVLSCYNPKIKTTPNIDRIAEEGVRFSKAISSAQWTVPSHASMFTGLYPSQHRTDWHYTYLDEEFLTLAECLSSRGYQTVGITENPFVSRRRGFSQGFDTFYEMYNYPRMAVFSRLVERAKIIFSDYRYTGEYARDSAAYLKRWLFNNQGKGASKPFFAFINFMPAHLPHYPRSDFAYVTPTPEEMARIDPVNSVPERYYLPKYKLSENELRTLRLLYLGDVSYLDSVLGEIYAFLDEMKLLDNTVLIITADHGENFGDHGYFEHFFSLHNTLIHVPLVIRFPREFAPGGVKDDVVSTVFLYQTVLDIIGPRGKRPDYPIEQRSLVGMGNSDTFVYAEHENAFKMVKGVIGDEAPEGFDFVPFDKYMKSIFSPDYKLIWSSNGKNEFYDMEKDWEENENVYSRGDDTALIYQEKLRQWLEALWRPPLKKKKKLDDKTEEALKALGYIK